MKLLEGAIWTDKKRRIFGLPLSFTRYMLTSTKLVVRTGFLNVREEEVELYKVTDKCLHLPLLERMFNCGTVNITSRDAKQPELCVKCIKNPREFYELLEQHVDSERNKYFVKGRDMYGAYGHSGAGAMDDDAGLEHID